MFNKWAAVLIAWIRPPWEARLRKEMRARPLTFRAGVVVKAGAVDPMQSIGGQLNLSVYGDAFEVSHPLPLLGFLNGVYYCYRAQNTTVEMVHGVRHDGIEICGFPPQVTLVAASTFPPTFPHVTLPPASTLPLTEPQ